MGSSSGGDAFRRFELENNIQTVDADQIYKYDVAMQQSFLYSKPWTKEPHYFKYVKISAVALLKMVIHARSGGKLEVMGIMTGKIDGSTMVITDTFALPIEGTEIHVNSHAAANEYMVEYLDLMKPVGRLENAIGWYHSHPGYGCYLSRTDVATQKTNQQYQDPWLAIVVDPIRTVSAGKVEIGAFRTHPQDYKPPDEGDSKILDYGVDWRNYYRLEISYFNSSLDFVILDKLWKRYWVNTLSSSPMFANRDYIAGAIDDLSEKLEQAESQLSQSGRGNMGAYVLPEKKEEESLLAKISRDSVTTTLEQARGMMAEVMKDILFNSKGNM